MDRLNSLIDFFDLVGLWTRAGGYSLWVGGFLFPFPLFLLYSHGPLLYTPSILRFVLGCFFFVINISYGFSYYKKKKKKL